jgi:2-polyprenyl-3-methyl-5-hydroxy-6-metoxy-1,4-benzoquinol methylase
MKERKPPHFDEQEYLAANPDVAAVVAKGGLVSGFAHFQAFGIYESRSLRPGVRSEPLKRPFPVGQTPDRRNLILSGLDLYAQDGIEIGALASPLVTKQEGNIFYVDHADTEALKSAYRLHPGVDLDKIVPVDGIWGQNTLQECMGGGRTVDYVVASHVIEHTPDFISWLQEICAVLHPGGTLRLAIPDKRYTFDIIRFETRLHDVIDAWLRKARTPLPRAVIEHHSLLRHVDAHAVWTENIDLTTLTPYTTMQHAVDLARDALMHGTYHDVHCWVFTPVSFAALCADLASLNLIDFTCDYFIDTQPGTSEFFVSMTLTDDHFAAARSWKQKAIELLGR